jgi:hypothetical protein
VHPAIVGVEGPFPSNGFAGPGLILSTLIRKQFSWLLPVHGVDPARRSARPPLENRFQAQPWRLRKNLRRER